MFLFQFPVHSQSLIFCFIKIKMLEIVILVQAKFICKILFFVVPHWNVAWCAVGLCCSYSNRQCNPRWHEEIRHATVCIYIHVEKCLKAPPLNLYLQLLKHFINIQNYWSVCIFDTSSRTVIKRHVILIYSYYKIHPITMSPTCDTWTRLNWAPVWRMKHLSLQSLRAGDESESHCQLFLHSGWLSVSSALNAIV